MLLELGQRLLNEQIEASTAARERLAALEGKRMAVAVRDSDLRFVAEIRAGELMLGYAREGDCDVELTAGAFDLLRLARSANLSALKDAGATLNGDPHVAEAFADLMRFAMPDPEAVLADWVGDMPAHALGEAARRAGRFGRRAGTAFTANLAEYLQEEQPTLLAPALAHEFAAAIEKIRDDVERAERRVTLLERKRKTPARPS